MFRRNFSNFYPLTLPALFFLNVTACTDAGVDELEPAPGERGPLGKADQVGSCAESDCDGQAPDGNCYCDDRCQEAGDCCADYEEVCQPPEIDPYDPESCPGAPADVDFALGLFEPGTTTTQLGGYQLHVRRRLCNEHTGCGPWQYDVWADGQTGTGKLKIVTSHLRLQIVPDEIPGNELRNNCNSQDTDLSDGAEELDFSDCDVYRPNPSPPPNGNTPYYLGYPEGKLTSKCFRLEAKGKVGPRSYEKEYHSVLLGDVSKHW